MDTVDTSPPGDTADSAPVWSRGIADDLPEAPEEPVNFVIYVSGAENVTVTFAPGTDSTSPLVVMVPGGLGTVSSEVRTTFPDLIRVTFEFSPVGYDYRGRSSQRVIRSVLEAARRFSTGPLIVVGESNGGNCGVAALTPEGAPLVDGLVTWETPAGAGFIDGEYGTVETGPNPAYLGDGTLDFTQVQVDPDSTTSVIDTLTEDETTEIPLIYVDGNGDGIRQAMEFVFSPVGVRTSAEGPLVGIVSPEMAARVAVLGVTSEGLPTVDESHDFWVERLPWSNLPDLPPVPVVVLASVEDHTQIISDHAHIAALYRAFYDARAPYLRLNPGIEAFTRVHVDARAEAVPGAPWEEVVGNYAPETIDDVSLTLGGIAEILLYLESQ